MTTILELIFVFYLYMSKNTQQKITKIILLIKVNYILYIIYSSIYFVFLKQIPKLACNLYQISLLY